MKYEPENSLQGKVGLEIDAKLDAERARLAKL
jgi:hypothetical protein